MVSITLGSNVLNYADDAGSGLVQAFGGGTIQDVTWTVSKDRLTIGPLAPGVDQYGNTVAYVAPTPEYIMSVIFSAGNGFPLRFRLSTVSNQPGWPNTLVGAQQCRADILAIVTP